MATIEKEFQMECDRCKTDKDVTDFAYIGASDEQNTSCSPFNEWKQICRDCATEAEMKRWYPNG